MEGNKAGSLTALAWERGPSKYSGSTLLVLIKLASLMRKEGYAWPTNSYLAAACGLSDPRRVQRITKLLKKDGALTIKKGAQGRNRYWVNREYLLSLALACPRTEEIEAEDTTMTTTPAPAQPQEPAALKLARTLEKVIRADVKDAIIPQDWETTWPLEIQPLLDAGHNFETLSALASHALKNQSMKVAYLKEAGARGFRENIEAIKRSFDAEKGKR